MAGTASVFEELAILAVLGGKTAIGAQLWGAADRVRETAALPYSLAQSERLPALRAKCREMLSTAVWEPEYERGRAMSFEEAWHAASELADQLLATERAENS